jgi:hypothetical protein
MSTATDILNQAHNLAVWVHTNTENIPRLQSDRTTYTDTISGLDLDDDQKLSAYLNLIHACSKKTSIYLNPSFRMQEFNTQHRELNQNILAYTPAEADNNTPLEGIIANEVEHIRNENARLKSYFIQMISGLITGVGLSAIPIALSPVNQDDSSDPEERTLADAWLCVLYFFLNIAILCGRTLGRNAMDITADWLFDHMPEKIKMIITAMANSPDDQFIASTPFFEAASVAPGIYAAGKLFNFIDGGHKPYNWLSLLIPPASILAGNFMGQLTDKIRLSSVGTLCSFSGKHSSLEQQRLLLTTNTATSLNNVDTSASQSSSTGNWLKKLCGWN